MFVQDRDPQPTMVNAATRSYASEPLSTKALAAAGQFRAIALWLNDPLTPQGIYAQVQQDKRSGCLRITLEFEREPQQKPLAKFVCHLIWQLNSPLIEGIHLIARPMGHTKPLWEQRIRIMTPALKARLHRAQGKPPLVSPVPPRLVPPTAPSPSGFPLQALLAEQLKTLRAFILTGSAVAAFVLGCLVEVGLSDRPEPSLPFAPTAEPRSREARNSSPAEPVVPDVEGATPALLVDSDRTASPTVTSSLDQKAVDRKATEQTEELGMQTRDRPRVVNAALEPVGVIEHDRVFQATDPTVTLVFGGGVNLDSLPYDQLEDGTQLLSALPNYQTADLALVHLRDPLSAAATSLEESLHNRKRPDAVDWLKEGGVDIVNLAGEEVLAGGGQGLAETLDLLDSHGIYRIGAGRSEREARRPEIVDVKGQRIAYLSYDLNPDQGAYDAVGGSNFAKLPEIAKDIRAIRDEVDWLVVNYRWTGIHPLKPADSPENLARLAIDQGADLVLGHHPTQLQGAELYKGRPIVYSLGDFIYGQPSDRTSEQAAMLQVSLRGGQMKVEMIPLKVKQGQPQRASGHEATQVWEKIRDASEGFAMPMPPSVVLEARSRTQPELTTPASSDGFTADPADLQPPEPWPTDTEPPELPPTNLPQELPAQSKPEAPQTMPVENPEAEVGDRPTSHSGEETEVAPETDILFEVEIDPIPKDLLKDWGPKKGSGTLYEPESALPAPLRSTPPRLRFAPPASSPSNRATPPTPEVPTPETPPLEWQAPVEAPAPRVSPQVHPAGDEIAPYNEPMLGPLSDRALPNQAQKGDPVAWAVPETRVLPPLSAASTSPGGISSSRQDSQVNEPGNVVL